MFCLSLVKTSKLVCCHDLWQFIPCIKRINSLLFNQCSEELFPPAFRIGSLHLHVKSKASVLLPESSAWMSLRWVLSYHCFVSRFLHVRTSGGDLWETHEPRLRVSVNCDWMEGSFWFLKKLFIVVSFFYLTGIMGNYLLSSVLIILLNFFVVVSVERFYIL